MSYQTAPLNLELNRVYTLSSLMNAVRLSSENPNQVLKQMQQAGESERVIALYDLQNFKTEFKHPLVTMIRKIGDNYWEGIMSNSTLGNTQPVSITRKFFKIKLDPSTENLSMTEIKE